jgi:DNA-binding transcriptional MerR regulator
LQIKKEYPISIASTRSGLSPHVIRKWEERYNAVMPLRSNGNHRLYSEADIERLSLLGRAVDAGQAIGKIADLSDRELYAIINDGNGANGTDADKIIANCLSSVRRLSFQDLRSEVQHALVLLGRNALVDYLLPRLMEIIGEQWADGTMRIMHERMVSSFCHTFLSSLLDTAELPGTAALVLAATLPRQQHYLGVLSAAVAANSAGWRAGFLGAGLPVEELAAAVETTGARALMLGLSYPIEELTLQSDMKVLKQNVPETVALIAGGSAAAYFSDFFKANDIMYVPDLKTLRAVLPQLF